MDMLSPPKPPGSGRHPDMLGPWRVGRSIGRDRGFRLRVVQNVQTRQYAAVKIVPRNQITPDANAKAGPPSASETPVLSEDMLKDLEREIALMKILVHPQMLALYDVWESSREIFIVTEYAGGGDLLSHLDKSNIRADARIAYYFRQVLMCLSYCHSIGVTFHGFQAESLLLDDSKGTVKLAAYDTARLETSSNRLSLGIRKDLWSCTVLLYKLLTHSYASDLEFESWAQFRSTASPPELPSTVSDDACELFDALFMSRNRNINTIPASELLEYSYFDVLPPLPPSHTVVFPPKRPSLTAKAINYNIYQELCAVFGSRVSEDTVRKRLLQPDDSKEKTVYHLLEDFRSKAPHSRNLNVSILRKPGTTDDNKSRPRNVSSSSNGEAPSSIGRNWPFAPQSLFVRGSPKPPAVAAEVTVKRAKSTGSKAPKAPSSPKKPLALKEVSTNVGDAALSRVGSKRETTAKKGGLEATLLGLGIVPDGTAGNSERTEPDRIPWAMKGKGRARAVSQYPGSPKKKNASTRRRKENAAEEEQVEFEVLGVEGDDYHYPQDVDPNEAVVEPTEDSKLRRRLSKIRKAPADTGPDTDGRRSAFIDDSIGRQNWLGAMMNTLRPAHASLLSTRNVIETRDECIRLLEQLQVVVFPSSAQTDVLSCELLELPYAAGVIETPKYVRFRVEFLTTFLPSHISAGFTSSLTLVREKGSNSSFKLIFNHLRRDWELDNPISPVMVARKRLEHEMREVDMRIVPTSPVLEFGTGSS